MEKQTATPKHLTILGVTGSIGQSALKILQHAPGRFEPAAFTAMERVDALVEAALAHRPRLAVIGNPALYDKLKEGLSGSGVAVAAGREALVDAARAPSDIVLSAIVGAACLRPTLAAIERGATVALANKECLVAAGGLMTARAKESGAKLLPVDSEHSAIFQVLDETQVERVEKVTLTASGGPFRTWPMEKIRAATPAQAVKHPNWSMGAKISVDSATLMNKGLELIEASHLFPVPADRLDVVIHPESIVHGLVEYCDGSVLAQLSNPDMCTPIACALSWPERMSAPVRRLKLAEIGSLTFEEPDTERFPALLLARAAMEAGGTAPVALNAANEVAVQAFLDGKIGFSDIVRVVEGVLTRLGEGEVTSLEAVEQADADARARAGEWIAQAA